MMSISLAACIHKYSHASLPDFNILPHGICWYQHDLSAASEAQAAFSGLMLYVHLQDDTSA